MIEWDWQEVALPESITGAKVWEALFAQEAIAVLLESPTTNLSQLSRFSIAAGKPRQVWTPKLGEILPCLRNFAEISSQSRASIPPDLVDLEIPFIGGYIGWLGYDFAWEIEHLPYLKNDTLPFPVAFWYEPREFAVVDHLSHRVYLAASDRSALKTMSDRLQNSLQTDSLTNSFSKNQSSAPNLSFSPDPNSYQNMVRQAQAHIQAGDIFQANLSLRYTCNWQGDGWQLYQSLQQINPSPFSSYWRTPWGEMISASPERLIKLQGDRLETRPIAGTRSRGNSVIEDQAQEQELLASAKEQSEHIMLLDLERNDLGKVCEWGTVKVDELLAIEHYSHVMHLVSNVVGNLRSELNGIDAIQATFPGGTITGCPKVRCMQIIETLEPDRRSLFYGSCGYLDRRGNLDLNILIRTLLKSGDRIYGQVGAGIVADSIPELEWLECLQKAKAQLAALGI